MQDGEQIRQDNRIAIQTAPIREKIRLRHVQDADPVLEMGTPVDMASLLDDTDVLMYGDIHTNYAIPDHLLQQVSAFKAGGVTSFGFEINPDPHVQEIFDEINSGNLRRVGEIDWSLGFGNPTVRQTKQELVVRLVQAGIKVYPFASWNRQGEIPDKPYTKESEEEAGSRISQEVGEGKTVVLVGGRHSEYMNGRKSWAFPHTADCVKSLGNKVRNIDIVGGMGTPGAYDRTPEGYIRRAAAEKNIHTELIINCSLQPIEGFNSDRILYLPTVPFLAANKPVPLERMRIGEFTPLKNVQQTSELEAVRAEIASSS